MNRSSVGAFRPWLFPAAVLAAFLSATLTVGPGLAQEKKGGKAPSAAKPGAGKAGAGKAGASKAAPEKPGTEAAAAKPAPASVEDVSFIAPYIGEKTFAVARIDLARIDVDALEQFATQLAATDLQVARQPNSVRIAAKMIKFVRWTVTELRDGGEKHVYVLFEHDENPVDGGALLVTPVPARIKPGLFSDLFTPYGDALGSVPRRSWSETDGAVLYGSPVQVTRAKERRAAASDAAAAAGKHGDLAEAFGVAAAADAPLRVALKPGDPTWKFIRTALPDLHFGAEQALAPVSDRWLTLAFTQKPEPIATVTARADDADRAAAVAARMADTIKGMSNGGVVPAWAKNAAAHHGNAVTVTTRADGIMLQFLAATQRNLARNPIQAPAAPAAAPAAPEGDGFD